MIYEKCHSSLITAEKTQLRKSCGGHTPAEEAKTSCTRLYSVVVPEPVPEPFLYLFYVCLMHAFVLVHLLVLIPYYIIGNIRVCYTIPYLVVLRVLQDMLVVLEILFYCKVTLWIFYK